MSTSPAADHEFFRLLWAACDNQATPEECAHLEQRVLDDSEACRAYVLFMSLHTDLLWQNQTSEAAVGSQQPAVSEKINQQSKISNPKLPSPVLAFLSRTASALNRPLVWSIVTVAAIFYGTFTVLSWNLRPDKLQSVAKSGAASVAVVRHTTDLQWSKDISSKSAESSILSGEPLKIESGTMELELISGTKLVVEGPADCSVDGDNSVSLRAGRLLATVPAQAVGFSVQTPTAKIVDLGTKFGVEVDKQGEAEVHVFQGRVVAEQAAISGTRPQRVELKKSEAARFTRNQTAIGRLSAAPERFQLVKHAAEKQTRMSPSLFGGLQLWLRADKGVYSHFSDDGDFSNDTAAKIGEPVQAWRDFSGHDRHALQQQTDARPMLVADELGVPKLRFDGDDDWLGRTGVVLDHADPSSFTIIVVFNTSSTSREARIFGQYNGHAAVPGSRVFCLIWGGRCIYDEFPPSEHFLETPMGSVVANKTLIGSVIRRGTSRSLRLTGDSSSVSVGPDTAEDYDPAPAGEPTEWRLGSMRDVSSSIQFFLGDVGELLVFNHALSESELRNLHEYLFPKFFPKQTEQKP